MSDGVQQENPDISTDKLDSKPNDQGLELTTPITSTANVAGLKNYAAHPPIVDTVEVLGYVTDVSGIFHSRDIGVSFQLFGRNYLIFGDTFCKNSDDQFVELLSNTVAIIEDPNKPTESRYMPSVPNGKIKAFIPLTEDEHELEKRSKHTDDSVRVALWAFGGVLEMDEDGTGRVWFQKTLCHEKGEQRLVGTGMAKVTPTFGGHLIVERSNIVFGHGEEPMNGTFSAIMDGDFAYLYGDNSNNNITLARVKKGTRMYYKNCYTYWNGAEYVHDPKEALPVLWGMCQGSIVRSKLFGVDKPFLFVGVSKWGDSQIMMDAAARLEGPWNPKAVYKATGINVKGPFMYCIYPHLWASDEEKGELVVSWSEPYPGGVIMARMKLAPITGTIPQA